MELKRSTEYTNKNEGMAKLCCIQTKQVNKLTANKNLSIKSAEDSEALITAYPEDIFILGRYISENHKPREWLFIGEQAFLRSWNNLNR